MIEKPGWQSVTAVMSRDIFLPTLSLSALMRSALAESLYTQVRLQGEKPLPSRGKLLQDSDRRGSGQSRAPQKAHWYMECEIKCSVYLFERGGRRASGVFGNPKLSQLHRETFGRVPWALPGDCAWQEDGAAAISRCNNWRQNLIFPDQGLNQTAFNFYASLSSKGCAGSLQVSKAFRWAGAGSIVAGEIL